VLQPPNICSPVYFPFHLEIKEPPIGFEIRAAMEMMAYIESALLSSLITCSELTKRVPVRTPICLTSEICAIREGARETKAPDPKPRE